MRALGVVSLLLVGVMFSVGAVQADLEDTDGDGIPDEWEMEHFGTLEYGAEDDPDGDGWDNYEEWTYGTDPMDPVSVPTPEEDDW
jgi:hypothetical protein